MWVIFLLWYIGDDVYANISVTSHWPSLWSDFKKLKTSSFVVQEVYFKIQVRYLSYEFYHYLPSPLIYFCNIPIPVGWFLRLLFDYQYHCYFSYSLRSAIRIIYIHIDLISAMQDSTNLQALCS